MPGRAHLRSDPLITWSSVTARRLALSGAVLVLLLGCASRVELTAPLPDPTTTPVCDAVMAALPATVLDGERRETTGGPYAAAWGNPAITLRCGVTAPAGLGPASECLEVDGVGWYEERQQSGSLFTTIGRTASVELAVPSDYAPEAGALVDVAGTITDHDPVQTPCAG